MPTSPASVDANRVRKLAARLGFALDGDEAARLAERIGAELPGYATLDDLAGDRRGPARHATDVRFDPGSDDDPHNAFVTRCLVDGAPDGPLAGYDVAVKDNLAVAGVPLTCGSRAFEGVVPGRHAAVVDRLLDAGARVVGKTNLDELAYGPTGETSAFGPVTNPRDDSRVTGGSSSGSTAAVAAGDADLALGSDTGGSVRIPAAFCGVVGFKPTWGAVPRDGIVDLAPTLDHIGPIAPDVETAALALDAIAGYDPRDPGSAVADRLPIGSFAADLSNAPDASDLSVGVPRELLAEHVSDGVRETVRGVLDDLAAAGATVEEVSLPTVPDAVYAWNAVTNTALASAFLTGFAPVDRPGPFDPALRDGLAAAARGGTARFGPTVREKALLGLHLLSAHGGRHYVRAQAVRERLRREFDAALDGRDALLAPTMPVVAPELGEWAVHSYGPGADDDGAPSVPLAFNTRPANLAGVPALTLPGGESAGLPVGLQVVGRRFDDADVLRLGRTLERFLS